MLRYRAWIKPIINEKFSCNASIDIFNRTVEIFSRIKLSNRVVWNKLRVIDRSMLDRHDKLMYFLRMKWIHAVTTKDFCYISIENCSMYLSIMPFLTVIKKVFFIKRCLSSSCYPYNRLNMLNRPNFFSTLLTLKDLPSWSKISHWNSTLNQPTIITLFEF